MLARVTQLADVYRTRQRVVGKGRFIALCVVRVPPRAASCYFVPIPLRDAD